jgi:hypothetical protein
MRALTSAGNTGRRRPRAVGTVRPAGAGAAAASSSAWAWVIPQWQTVARRGTLRPQLGHRQVWEGVSATAPILDQSRGTVGSSARAHLAWGRMSPA